MALREIRLEGDPVLTKECRPVKDLTERQRVLIEDMLETMYDADGVGLAAPQVGVLRRICVVDVADEHGPYILINPKIIEKEGEQTGQEGCLSVPGKAGTVTRPMKVKVEAYDLDMNLQTYEGEGLLARALCHEIDHLDGHMYTEIAEGPLYEVSAAEEEEDEEEDEASSEDGENS